MSELVGDGNPVEESTGNHPDNENGINPLDIVRDMLEDIKTGKELRNCQELFDFCAGLDDVTYQYAKNVVTDKAETLKPKVKTDVLKTMDVCRNSRKEQKREEHAQQASSLLSALIRIEQKPSDECEIPDMLGCPPWLVDENGISYSTRDGPVIFCHNPMVPSKILHNIENNKTKVEIAFVKRGKLQRIIVDKTVLSKSSSITELSEKGINMTYDGAKMLVSYLADVEALNEERIPLIETTTKLGWGPVGTKYEHSFVPFDDDLTFDGLDNFRELFQAIQAKGSPDKWMKLALEIRKRGTIAPRIALAASFASTLVGPLKISPFIVDFWGTTEKGKTVLLMLAASVWADPTVGRYISGFRSTPAGFEILADALNSLPLILDDSSNSDKYLEFEPLIYSLCEGAGKTRSNKALGRQRQTNWRNTILTNGERPLHRMAKQGGAINRVLEINCNGMNLFENPRAVCKVIQRNYGHVGREFVKRLKEEPVEKLEAQFGICLEDIIIDAMDKQKQAVACIVLADQLATRWIFKDDRELTCDEISEFLTNPNDVSEGQRAYSFLSDQISINEQHFTEDARADLWGRIDAKAGRVYFFRAALDSILQSGGFDLDVLLTWCKDNGLLVHSSDKNSIPTRMNIMDDEGNNIVKVIRCICIKISPTKLPTNYDSN